MGAKQKRNSKEAIRNPDDSVEQIDERPLAHEPEIDGSTINKLLAEADSQSQEKGDEAAQDGEFEETWNFDSTQELIAPEEIFSSDDLKGKT